MFCVKKKWKIVTTRPMLIEVMAPYARIPRAPGPCRLQALRWEGLRSSALSGFSSGCRDPATTEAVDDLTFFYIFNMLILLLITHETSKMLPPNL